MRDSVTLNHTKKHIKASKSLLDSPVGVIPKEWKEQDLTITYRTATVEDIPILCTLLHQLFSKEVEFTPDITHQTKGLKMIIEDEKIGEIYVACKEGEIVGMVNLLYTVSTALGERVALLEDMIIDEKHRGEDIGSALLEYVLTVTKEKWIKRVTLLTDADNLSAHRFYESMGFSKSAMIPFRIQL
jgi:GNAT superfamily N-acetyltransferase